jgi:Holin of 3TMs, for gene-transfer release
MAGITIGDPISTIIGAIGGIIDRVIGDKAAANQAKAALLEAEVQGQLQNALSQLQVDQAEAQSGNKFAADWRPMFGYVCALSFAYSMIVQPIAQGILAIYRPQAVQYLKNLDMSTMMPIALGMLGLSATHVASSLGNGNQ